MAHGPDQAILGLGRPATNVSVNQPGILDETEDNDLAALGVDNAELTTHAALTTGVHGVGASTVAKLTDVTDHTTDATAAHAASAVSIADAGLYTATTEVEAALQQIYSRLPYTIEQSTSVVIDGDSSGGGNGLGVALTATNLVAPVVASKKYLVEGTIQASATSNGGIKFDFTAPAAATMVWHAHVHQSDGNTVNAGNGTPYAVGDAMSYTAAALAEDKIDFWGILTVDATAGNLTLRAAQVAAHADNTTVHAESWLRVTPLQ